MAGFFVVSIVLSLYDFSQAYVNRGNAKYKMNDKEGAC